MISLLLILVSLQDDPTRVEPMALRQAPPRPLPQGKVPPNVTPGPVIPGLRQGAVPQGLAFIADRNWFVISCYFDDGRPSMLGVVDAGTGRIVKSLALLEPDGSIHTGHVGGVAASKEDLWVASGAVYRIPLKDLSAAKPVDWIRLRDRFRAESVASYASVHDGVLWVGEFVQKGRGKKGSPHHAVDRRGKDRYAWISGYRLGRRDEFASAGEAAIPPDLVIAVPEEVQGLAFMGQHLYLTTSYGRSNPSKLIVARDPTRTRDPDRTAPLPSGVAVPCWIADEGDAVAVREIAPMAEGIVAHGRQLALIFESGAEKYQRGGKGSIDHIMILDQR